MMIRVRSRLTPWDHSTAGALRLVAREKARVEVGRGGYDNKTVRSRLTPWDHSTTGALRFVAREKQRVEVGRGGRSLFWLKDVSGRL
jgi:hypothetical protein